MAGEDDLISMNFDDGGGNDEGDVIVSLPVDTGAAVVKKAEGDKPAPKAGDEDPAADLKKQFETMSARATAAEARNAELEQSHQQASQRVTRLETEVVSSQLDTVMSGIEACDAEAAVGEQEYTAAFEAGDAPAMARAQRKMAAAEARKLRLTEAKDDLEEQAKRRPAPGTETRQQPPQRRAAPSDPVEAFLQNNRITGRSADFIRKHPETTTDRVANARMMAAHNSAIADGVEVESDEYFRRIEEGLTVTKKAEPQQQRRPSSAAAPAGGTGGALNGGGTEVRLTKGEAKSATDGTLVWNWDDPDGKFKRGDPIGLAEMARRKHHGMKNGLYDRSFSES